MQDGTKKGTYAFWGQKDKVQDHNKESKCHSDRPSAGPFFYFVGVLV